MMTINFSNAYGGKEIQHMEKFLNAVRSDENRNAWFQAGELILVGCVLFGMLIPMHALL